MPSTTLWDMFTYTFPQMKVLKFSYMSTKQFPIALPCAYFWYQRSETSNHGSNSLSPPEQEEIWALACPWTCTRTSAPSVQCLQSNIWKHSGEKQVLQRLLQCETTEDDLASNRWQFALNFPSFSFLTCLAGNSRSESHNHDSTFETALSSFPKKIE